ncbi:MAG: hypothetical protein D6782_08680, partial [Alphaproteobacteria bacterium]
MTLTGQLLIKHDICAQHYPALGAVKALLADSNYCVSDLEVAIRGPNAEPPTRGPEFLHVATPDILHCVRELGFHALSLALSLIHISEP